MSLFKSHPKFTATYLGGFPHIKYKTSIVFEVQDDSLHIKILKGFKWERIKIPAQDILEVGLDKEVYRSAGKAAAGAIAGGLLTGGIGLIAGAALGGKRRNKNELLLIVRYNARNCIIDLKPSKQLPKLYQEIKRIIPIVEELESNDVVVDIPSQLEKFHQLMEKGIITKEEFEQKKQELLNS